MVSEYRSLGSFWPTCWLKEDTVSRFLRTSALVFAFGSAAKKNRIVATSTRWFRRGARILGISRSTDPFAQQLLRSDALAADRRRLPDPSLRLDAAQPHASRG